MTGVQGCPIAHPVAWTSSPRSTWSAHVSRRLRARTVACIHAHSVADFTPDSRSSLPSALQPLARSRLPKSWTDFEILVSRSSAREGR